MKRLILLSTLGFLATDALANHLLHNVPADVVRTYKRYAGNCGRRRRLPRVVR